MLEEFVLSGSASGSCRNRKSHSQRQVFKCKSHTFRQTHGLAACVAQELYSEVPCPVFRCRQVPQPPVKVDIDNVSPCASCALDKEERHAQFGPLQAQQRVGPLNLFLLRVHHHGVCNVTL